MSRLPPTRMHLPDEREAVAIRSTVNQRVDCMPQPLNIPPNWQLPEEFKSRIGSSVGRQRMMHTDGHLLILAHMVPEPDENSRRGIMFWRTAEGEWKASNGDPGNGAVKMHLDRFAKKLDEYELMESKAQSSHEYLPLLEGLAPIARTMRNFLEVLEEARKSLPTDRNMIDHRDRAYELSRQAELLYDDAKNSMDVAVVRRAEEQARASHQMTSSAHRLNIMAALFFPFATLGAVFGTTLTDNWSWSQSMLPFLLFLLLGLATGAVLAVFVSRPPKDVR